MKQKKKTKKECNNMNIVHLNILFAFKNFLAAETKVVGNDFAFSSLSRGLFRLFG
ncbi:hypothetical protein PGB90_001993 [Kerria lacca]